MSVRRHFFFQAEDGIRDHCVTGVQTCALPICMNHKHLLRFIKKKMKNEAEIPVARNKKSGDMMTLGAVCLNKSMSQL